LTLAWDAETTTSIQVDEYEKTRGERRTKDKLHVPAHIRREWLLEEGYTRKDIRAAEVAALRVQRERFESSDESFAVAESKDRLKRKFKKWVLQKPNDKKIYQKWKQTAMSENPVLAQREQARSLPNHPQIDDRNEGEWMT